MSTKVAKKKKILKSLETSGVTESNRKISEGGAMKNVESR